MGRRQRRSGLDSTAVAFLGLGVLLATRRAHPRRHRQGRRRARHLHLVRGPLHAERPAQRARASWATSASGWRGALGGLPWRWPGLVLVVAYVLLHYLFVSQTAHLLALFGVFLDVGVKLGVPAAPLAFLLLFATQLLLGHHAAGLERQPAVRGQRLPVAGRAVPARRDHRPRSTCSVYLLVRNPVAAVGALGEPRSRW